MSNTLSVSQAQKLIIAFATHKHTMHTPRYSVSHSPDTREKAYSAQNIYTEEKEKEEKKYENEYIPSERNEAKINR